MTPCITLADFLRRLATVPEPEQSTLRRQWKRGEMAVVIARVEKLVPEPAVEARRVGEA